MNSYQWKLTVGHEDPIYDPSWATIQDKLDRIDGVTQSFLTLDLTDDGSLWAAGGNNGRYLVIYMIDQLTQTSLTLAAATGQGPDVELLIDGVASQYPFRFGVSKAMVLDVFKHFFTIGTIPQDLAWEDY